MKCYKFFNLSFPSFPCAHAVFLTTDTSQTLDLSRIVDQLHFIWTQFPVSLSRETLCEIAFRYFLTDFNQSMGSQTISKMELFKYGQNYFQNVAQSVVHEDTSWGSVDIIYENDLAGLYRLKIAPLKGIPLHFHAKTS